MDCLSKQSLTTDLYEIALSRQIINTDWVMTDILFDKQVEKLEIHHFLILYWAAEAEVLQLKYNITNVFDDLKDIHVTRTKQSVTAYLESLEMLCFIEVKDEKNRKNIYITEFGAQAIQKILEIKNYKTRKSRFLGGHK